MSFNVDKYFVMHIGHNNMQNDRGIYESSSARTSSAKNKQRKVAKRPTEYWGSLPTISGSKTKN